MTQENDMKQETEDKMVDLIAKALETGKESHEIPQEFAEQSDIIGLNALQKDHQAAELRKKVAELEADLLAHKIEIVRLQFTLKYGMQGSDTIDTKTGLITRNR